MLPLVPFEPEVPEEPEVWLNPEDPMLPDVPTEPEVPDEPEVWLDPEDPVPAVALRTIAVLSPFTRLLNPHPKAFTPAVALPELVIIPRILAAPLLPTVNQDIIVPFSLFI